MSDYSGERSNTSKFGGDQVPKLNTETGSKRTPLDILIDAAARGDDEEIRKLMVKREYRDVVNDVDSYEKYTPLIWAAKVVDTLCEWKDVDIDKPGGWVSLIVY